MANCSSQHSGIYGCYFIPGASALDTGKKNLKFYECFVQEYCFLSNNSELWTGIGLARQIHLMQEQIVAIVDPSEMREASKIISKYKKLYQYLTKQKYTAKSKCRL